MALLLKAFEDPNKKTSELVGVQTIFAREKPVNNTYCHGELWTKPAFGFGTWGPDDVCSRTSSAKFAWHLAKGKELPAFT